MRALGVVRKYLLTEAETRGVVDLVLRAAIGRTFVDDGLPGPCRRRSPADEDSQRGEIAPRQPSPADRGSRCGGSILVGTVGKAVGGRVELGIGYATN
jgi:hypothetical protein